MPAGNVDASTASVTEIESDANLRVDCYVRATVPPAITETIRGVVDRLHRLDERDLIGDYRVTHWPPECRSIGGPTGEGASTRDELVAEFERWAARSGHSLEPAFNRREIPSSPFDVGTDEPRERVRVPVVALAIYDDAAGADASETDAETASLRGVVPCTERSQAERSRTYTVDDWLSIVEPDGGDSSPGTRRHEGPTPVEGHQ